MNRFVDRLTKSRFHGAGAYATTAVRVVAGAVFVSVSTGKFVDHMQEAMDFKSYGVPIPDTAVYVVGVLELVCGLLLVVGLFTRVGALLLAANMVGAISTVGVMEGQLPPGRRTRAVGRDAVPAVGGAGRARARQQAGGRRRRASLPD